MYILITIFMSFSGDMTRLESSFVGITDCRISEKQYASMAKKGVLAVQSSGCIRR